MALRHHWEVDKRVLHGSGFRLVALALEVNMHLDIVSVLAAYSNVADRAACKVRLTRKERRDMEWNSCAWFSRGSNRHRHL